MTKKITAFISLIGVVAMLGTARGDGPIAPSAAEPSAPLVDWSMASYRVQLYFRVDAAPGWTAAMSKQFIAQVADRAGGMAGGVWQIKAAVAPSELHWDRAGAVGRVALAAMPAAALDGDKVILVGFAPSRTDGPRFWARELDVRTRLWSPVVVSNGPRLSAPMDRLVERAVQAAWSVFRPLGRIESVADQAAVVRIRGGGLPAASRSLRLAGVATAWQPIIRHFDATGKTVQDGVFPIASTFLSTTGIDGAVAKCTLISGVQDPLAIEYDGRTEYLAMAVTGRATDVTALVCLTRGTPVAPLAGLDVLVRDAPNQPPRLVGQTDASGKFQVRGSAAEATTVYIRSGDDLLARFPLVPGLEPNMTIRLDDTGRRPETAAFVAAKRVELLDLSTQQRLLATRFQRQVVNSQFDDAANSIAALQSLSTSDEFLKSLDEFRTKLAAAADSAAITWLDKQLEPIKAAAPTSLLSAADVARLANALATMRRK